MSTQSVCKLQDLKELSKRVQFRGTQQQQSTKQGAGDATVQQSLTRRHLLADQSPNDNSLCVSTTSQRVSPLTASY